MIFVNGIRLNMFQASTSGLSQEAAEEMSQIITRTKREFDFIKKQKRQVIFKVPDPNPVNSSGELEPKRSVTIPMKAIVNGDYGTEEWIYTSSTPSRSSDVIELSSAEASLLIIDELPLDPQKDFELIYFLRKISSAVRKGHIYEYDEEAKAAEFFEGTSRQDELKLAIKSLNNIEYLYELASSWGIEDSTSLELNSLKLKLFQRVIFYETNYSTYKRGISEFIQDVNFKGEGMIIRNLVQTACDKRLIIKDPQTLSYHYADGNGLGALLYKPYPGDSVKGIDALFNYVLDNSYETENIRRLLNGEKPAEKKWTLEEINNLTWFDFKKYCPVNTREKGVSREILTQRWVESNK